MTYTVNFTDRENKPAITVYDNTSNTDTSLTFPGRNVTGYGRIIAENFVALLENFARDAAPVNPVEGQLWYDTQSGSLQIFDSEAWKAASGIQKSSTQPVVETSNIGELWVDTVNQQLYVFSGQSWILVGPTFSTGLRSGPVVEQILDTDNELRAILSLYVEDVPVFIISKDSFTPKITIPGFVTIRSGLNVTTSTIDDAGLDTLLYGRTSSADSLNIAGTEIPSSRFLRSDVINTVESGFNIRNNQGLTIGADGNFSLTTSATATKIYNSTPGSSVDLQTNRDGIPATILRVLDNRVAINKALPEETLDVDGNILTNGIIRVTNNSEATNVNNGSIRTSGGMSITKNLIVGDTLEVTGTSNFTNIQPKITDTYDSGSESKRWNTIRTRTLIAERIEGVLEGNIVGNATTATSLRFTTAFSMVGDVASPTITFDGSPSSGLTKAFNTSLTANIIKGKSEVLTSTEQDFLLIYRASAEVGGDSGLLKIKRDEYVADLAVPIGASIPFAGPNAPPGYLLCDGSEVERVKFPDLFDVIGTIYGSTSLGVNTFRLPDLRGRFALGKDNMDNGGIVPNSVGGFVDAGGGNVDRVPGTAADNLAGTGGQSSNSLTLANLPDHEHSMRGSTGQQYYATRTDTAATVDIGAFSGVGPTTPGQSQYLPSSGRVTVPSGFTLGQPFAVMNPYLTLNYIIRSGPPKF
jgi:microcystin-dependent protein